MGKHRRHRRKHTHTTSDSSDDDRPHRKHRKSRPRLLFPDDFSESEDLSDGEIERRNGLLFEAREHASENVAALQLALSLQRSQRIDVHVEENAADTEEPRALFDKECGWLEDLEGISRHYEYRHKQWKAQASIPSRWQLHFDGEEQIVPGDERLRKIYWVFNNLKWKRKNVVLEQPQLDFLDLCIKGLLPKIYGATDYDSNQERILEEHGISKIEPRIISLQPRREGKTFATCVLALALLYSVPGLVSVVFSTGGRVSNKFMETVLELGSTLPDFKERIVRQTQEDLFIAATPLEPGNSKSSDAARDARIDSATSKLHSYPSNSKGLRGVGGDVLYLEEAHYINQDIFKYNVVPLVQVKHTGVIAISSPSDESNYASTLSDARLPSGEYIFHTHMSNLACAKCKAKPTGKSCPHKKYQRIVSHKQAKNVEIAKALLSEKDRQQEIEGMIGRTDHLFSRWSTVFRESQPATLRESVQMIHTFIDPSANGAASDFVIDSAATVDGKCVLLGMDEFTSVESNITAWDAVLIMMYDHVQALLDKHRDARVWVYIEANLNKPLAAHYGRLLQQRFGSRVLLERLDPDGAGNVGVWTGAEEKELYAHCLRSLLSNGNLLYANDMIGRDVAASKEKLFRQLNAYTRVVKPPQHDVDFLTPRWTYSGKTSGPDDVCVAVQALAYHIQRQQTTPYYYETCEKLGITKI